MFSQSTHPGNLPIRVLAYNILNKFELEGLKAIPNFKESLANGLVSPGLQYKIEKESLHSPFANLDTKQINLQEVFLSFMWAFSYSTFLIVEKGIQERVTKPEWKGEIIFDTDLLIKANQLLSWALTLNVFYSDWDLDLPNPEKPNNAEERFYVEKVNGIYENATCYILFHEYAHLTLGHNTFINTVRGKNKTDLKDEEIKKYKELEEEADKFAFTSLVSGAENEQEKFHKGVAIILAHCAMLFMVHNPKGIKKITHPDTDIRLEDSIKKLNIKDSLLEDYIWTIGCFACMKFLNIHNIIVNISPKDPKPLFKDYMVVFDKIKI